MFFTPVSIPARLLPPLVRRQGRQWAAGRLSSWYTQGRLRSAWQCRERVSLHQSGTSQELTEELKGLPGSSGLKRKEPTKTPPRSRTQIIQTKEKERSTMKRGVHLSGEVESQFLYTSEQKKGLQSHSCERYYTASPF